MLARNHRSPYGFLLAAIILSFLVHIDNIVFIVITDWSRLIIALGGMSLLFNNWATLLLFLTLVAFLWDRENAIRVMTGGSAGRRNPAVIALHAVLAVLILVLGTAGPAVYINAYMRYVDGNMTWYSFLKQRKVREELKDAYAAFVVLAGVDIAVSTIVLWSTCRTIRVTDKVCKYSAYHH